MFMVSDKYRIAFEKAKAINSILATSPRESGFISLDDITAAVKEVSGYAEIFVTRQSFSKLKLPKNYKNDPMRRYGAMLSTMTRENTETEVPEKIAYLVVNSDNSADMQRFSVAHELGHLVTDLPNFTYEEADDGLFTISAHINPDITYLPDAVCEKDDYMTAEQVANIFALLVLVPNDLRIRDIRDIGVEELAKRYGVTEDAIYSRMLLSSVNRE